jgi:hypothetical protein
LAQSRKSIRFYKRTLQDDFLSIMDPTKFMVEYEKVLFHVIKRGTPVPKAVVAVVGGSSSVLP